VAAPVTGSKGGASGRTERGSGAKGHPTLNLGRTCGGYFVERVAQQALTEPRIIE
jgi:hypothetical protein